MKTMKVIPLFFLLLLLSFGCEEKRDKEMQDETDRMAVAEVESREVDQMMEDWKQAWNANDAESLEKMAADDAVLLFFGEAKTDDELNQWLRETSEWMKDLESTPLKKKVGDLVAYEAGTFIHSSKSNDTMQYEGAYVVVWERPAMEGEWKIKMMNISPKVEMDSLQGDLPSGKLPKEAEL